MTEAKYIKT